MPSTSTNFREMTPGLVLSFEQKGQGETTCAQSFAIFISRIGWQKPKSYFYKKGLRVE